MLHEAIVDLSESSVAGRLRLTSCRGLNHHDVVIALCDILHHRFQSV